jgi:hypothetical protein
LKVIKENIFTFHELLHTLGLDHPGHEGGSDSSIYTADSTIMRYYTGNEAYVFGKEIVTPMVYDIALLQQKYGVNYGVENQNYVLQVDQLGGSKSIASTLWLGGGRGENHIDASHIQDASYGLRDARGEFYNKIDLRGGFEDVGGKILPRFSQVGKEVFTIALDPEKDWQEAIEIENAIGTDQNDRIIGNMRANHLQGGKGRDTIIGGEGAGKDTLDGGEENDILIYDNRTAKDRFQIDFDDSSLPPENGLRSAELHGREGDDILLAGGEESRLFGGEGKDIFSLSNMSFIMDGETSDRSFWGGYLISGGVQQWWQEGGYAYYSAAAPLVNVGIGSQILLGALTLFDAPFMTSTRFAMSTSGQLLIQKGRSDNHTAFVQDYDYEDAAGITVFRQALTTDVIASNDNFFTQSSQECA